MIVKMAPEPRDIYWPNLSAPSARTFRKFFRSVLAVMAMFLLVFSSTLVVSSIAALIDLKQLGVLFPPLGNLFSGLPETWFQLIQGIIPTALLAAWNSCLPSILLFLCQAQGIEAESWIQGSLLSKYFFYLIWNVIFVIPFARSFVSVIVNPQEVIERLGMMLPKSSVTMMNYILLQGFVLFPVQLLQAVPILYTWMIRIWFRGSPRRFSYAYYPSILNVIYYGIVYPMPILVLVIGLMYAAISPLILPICALYFAIGYFVYKVCRMAKSSIFYCLFISLLMSPKALLLDTL
jgi:hypothetical protein